MHHAHSVINRFTPCYHARFPVKDSVFSYVKEVWLEYQQGSSEHKSSSRCFTCILNAWLLISFLTFECSEFLRMLSCIVIYHVAVLFDSAFGYTTGKCHVALLVSIFFSLISLDYISISKLNVGVANDWALSSTAVLSWFLTSLASLVLLIVFLWWFSASLYSKR